MKIIIGNKSYALKPKYTDRFGYAHAYLSEFIFASYTEDFSDNEIEFYYRFDGQQGHILSINISDQEVDLITFYNELKSSMSYTPVFISDEDKLKVIASIIDEKMRILL